MNSKSNVMVKHFVLWILFLTSPLILSQTNVKIGNQVWMTKNLDIAIFRNGDSISQAKTARDWQDAGKKGQPAWCYYAYNPINGDRYGKLYNWYAVNDSRGIAPEGYHIPTRQEWQQLISFLGSKEIAAAKLKSTSGWLFNGKGNNSSGFDALPGGYCYGNGNCYDLIDFSYWWSSTQEKAKKAWYCQLNFSLSLISGNEFSKENGLSVRCIKD
jgi:uncharacterized protein (TIGR02145 family)